MKLPKNYVPGEGVRKASGYGGKGQRMLELMGWRKGQGLGPAKDGMREALEAKEKKDTAGIGASQSWDWNAKFWEDSYNSMAGKIQHEHSSSSDSSSSDEDTLAVVANKCRRTSGASASTSSSSSSSDTPASRANQKRITGKLGSHQQKRRGAVEAVERVGWRGRAGKLARIAQHEAAEAARLEALLKSGEGGKRTQGAGGSSDGKGLHASAQAQADGEAAGKSKLKKKPVVITLSIPDGPEKAELEAFKPTPLTGWWGAGYFRSAGAMGENEEAVAVEGKDEDACKLGFDEDDQAALYMQAHNNQRRGHTGLGQSTRTLKIAGGRWEGSRMTFGEDDEGQDGEAQAAVHGIEAGGKDKSTKKRKKKERATEGEEEQGEGKTKYKKGKKAGKKAVGEGGVKDLQVLNGGECSIEGHGDEKASKKKKVKDAGMEGVKSVKEESSSTALKSAKAMIREAPKQRMKISKLCARLVHQYGGSQESVSALLQRKAKKSKLVIVGGYVQLPVS